MDGTISYIYMSYMYVCVDVHVTCTKDLSLNPYQLTTILNTICINNRESIYIYIYVYNQQKASE